MRNAATATPPLPENDVIFDILPPVAPSFWAMWWPWILSAGLLTLVALALVWWLVRRRSRRTPKPIEPALMAYSRLSRLDQSDSIDMAQCANATASIVRDYLAASNLLPANRMTTDEIAAQIASSRIAADLQTAIVSLLQTCDAARFAGSGMSSDEHKQWVASARAIIEQLDTEEQTDA